MNKHTYTRALLALIIALTMMPPLMTADEHYVVLHRQGISDYVPVDSVDSIMLRAKDSLVVAFSNGRTDTIPEALDSMTVASSTRDTLYIYWSEGSVRVLNPFLAEDVRVSADSEHVKVRNHAMRCIPILAAGHAYDGSLTLKGDRPANITIRDLALEAITITGDSIVSFTVEDYNRLGRIKSDGDMTFRGSGTMNMMGAYDNLIRSKGSISAEGLCIGLHLPMACSKGMKAGRNIALTDVTLYGEASGGVKVQDGDPSYCMFLKCGGGLTLDGVLARLRHDGVGGKGFVSEGTMTIRDSKIDMLLTGFGAPFLVGDGTELDFFTPRCLESKGDMQILSGEYSLRATGTGGKGIVAGRALTIGTPDACDDSTLRGEADTGLRISVTTEGTACVDDVLNDKRYGCPKAIKCGGEMVVEGGLVCTHTMGMGGEGIESKGTLVVNGGTLVCQSFDDGINVEHGITINGGRIYATSTDNDGIDSNGFIALNGGVVASLTSHERDEDFDCDDDRFFLRGGTICGIGRDCSGIFHVEQPYIQHIAYVRDKANHRVDTLASYNIPKDTYITYADPQGQPVMTVLVHDDIPAAFATMSSPMLKEGEEVSVFLTAEPPHGAKPLIEGKVWMGGEAMSDVPLFADTATMQPYNPLPPTQAKRKHNQ